MWWQLLVVIAAAACLYFVLLGSSGFAFSEGQRVFPGWNMARHGDWLMPHLFEQPYLRKPPGMPWAVALFSFVLGESEFSARAVSAVSVTLGGILSLLFARRWFGGVWGLIAGLAFILTPLYWYPGRSAEIEALHNLFVQASLLIMIELLINRPRGPAGWTWAALLGLTVAGMAIVKGPSGAPCLGGVLAGAWLITRSPRTLLNTHICAGLATGGAIAAYVLWRIAQRVAELPEPPVLQGAEQFLYKPGHLMGVLTLPLTALAAGLPWSANLAFALPRPRDEQPEDSAGRTASISILAAIAIYTVIGVSNSRYTMPVTTLLPIVVAYSGRRLERADIPAWADLAARLTGARRPWLWMTALSMLALGSLVYTENRRANDTTGLHAGRRLGELLPDGARLWGDALLDNRPEVGHYAQQHAASLGKRLHVRWMPLGMPDRAEFPVPPPGGYLAVLEAGETELKKSELQEYTDSGVLDGLELVHVDHAHKFIFRIFRVPLPGARLVEKPPKPPSLPRGNEYPDVLSAFFSQNSIRTPCHQARFPYCGLNGDSARGRYDNSTVRHRARRWSRDSSPSERGDCCLAFCTSPRRRD